jgi:hypothetical protein
MLARPPADNKWKKKKKLHLHLHGKTNRQKKFYQKKKKPIIKC